MNVALTLSAWKGLRRFLDDPIAQQGVDNILALARPLSGRPPEFVTATMDGHTVSLVVTAYRRWATAMRLS